MAGEPSARVAAVSAFGFGGTNFHVVLSGYSPARRGLAAWPAELFVFRGQTDEAAYAAIRSLLDLAAGSARCATSPAPRRCAPTATRPRCGSPSSPRTSPS
ncbi:hypothetical protein ACFQV2_15380 [Actinokineospora soli]|uniref:Polyketide synthase C-terminal extension domain-containing protein n=1 Tax=Actinokineospora soli TaxID=1048753 RepID=A0ABW2TMH8_9PSEU